MEYEETGMMDFGEPDWRIVVFADRRVLKDTADQAFRDWAMYDDGRVVWAGYIPCDPSDERAEIVSGRGIYRFSGKAFDGALDVLGRRKANSKIWACVIRSYNGRTEAERMTLGRTAVLAVENLLRHKDLCTGWCSAVHGGEGDEDGHLFRALDCIATSFPVGEAKAKKLLDYLASPVEDDDDSTECDEEKKTSKEKEDGSMIDMEGLGTENRAAIGGALGAIGLVMSVASVFIGTIFMILGLMALVAGGIVVLTANRSSTGLRAASGAVCGVALIAVLIICVGSIVTVDAGEKGVVVNSPAGNLGEVIDEGWHFDTKYMVSSIETIRFNTQTVEYVGSDDSDDTIGGITVLTSDNLTVDMDLAVSFHIPSDYVSSLRFNYGADWKVTVLHQEVRSIPRLVCAQFTALEIVGGDRDIVEDAIKSRLTESIEKKGVIVDNVVIRELRIPKVMTEAVEQKLAAQQMLEKAQIDLQRIQVEAQASAEAVDKVRAMFDSDEAYLQYILYQNLKDMEGVQVVLSDNGTLTVKTV